MALLIELVLLHSTFEPGDISFPGFDTMCCTQGLSVAVLSQFQKHKYRAGKWQNLLPSALVKVFCPTLSCLEYQDNLGDLDVEVSILFSECAMFKVPLLDKGSCT